MTRAELIASLLWALTQIDGALQEWRLALDTFELRIDLEELEQVCG